MLLCFIGKLQCTVFDQLLKDNDVHDILAAGINYITLFVEPVKFFNLAFFFFDFSREKFIIGISIDSNTAKIAVRGNTWTIATEDTVNIIVTPGLSDVKSISVKKDNGSYLDITGTWQNGTGCSF